MERTVGLSYQSQVSALEGFVNYFNCTEKKFFQFDEE